MDSILLDTCAFLWLGMGGGELTAAAKNKIANASSVYCSPMSAWEDRIIISSALFHNLTVATGDRRFGEYGVRTIK